jgi:hypothetical protein
VHVVSSEESSDLLQGEDSAQIISHEIVLRADMQDYWVKLVQDNKIEKLSQESSHGGICRFLVDTGQANCSVVNKQFNCIARPRGAHSLIDTRRTQYSFRWIGSVLIQSGKVLLQYSSK